VVSVKINVRWSSFWWTIKWWPAGAISANVIAIPRIADSRKQEGSDATHFMEIKGLAKEEKNVAFYVNFFILFRTSLAALIPEMTTIGIPPPGKVQWPA
jgi:hypothetical protein